VKSERGRLEMKVGGRQVEIARGEVNCAVLGSKSSVGELSE
jgi:hypothetical protein